MFYKSSIDIVFGYYVNITIFINSPFNFLMRWYHLYYLKYLLIKPKADLGPVRWITGSINFVRPIWSVDIINPWNTCVFLSRPLVIIHVASILSQTQSYKNKTKKTRRIFNREKRALDQITRNKTKMYFAAIASSRQSFLSNNFSFQHSFKPKSNVNLTRPNSICCKSSHHDDETDSSR